MESKWNNPIDKVYSDISISQNNNQLLKTITPTTSLLPRETKQLETFLELTDINTGEYDIEFTLNYANKESKSKGKLNVIKKEFPTTIIATLTIIFLLIILILWYTILKKKTNKKNAKNT